MYRQILVDTRDVDYQRILWKAPTEECVNEFRLLTVTYGTVCAPYLALRVLKQFAHDEGARFPLATSILTNNIYVDDCVFGAEDKPLALQTRDQLIQLLGKASFRLRKWTSNCPTLIRNIDPTDHGLASDKLFSMDESLKILGIAWNPESDSFRFQINLSLNIVPAKRTILSTIAKMYDPLGWVTPVIITAKILMQKLWLQQCS
ncbi:hypothetical protein RF55_10433 [Lasius niger]|uniref:Reverse transcriptase domain-containing protein n=1 Tax=Lasius niger TaxID=67767 RepID=A0A0J7KI31_LASNI|nr:hypothetical protein RF55_10433 [Lasius niger]